MEKREKANEAALPEVATSPAPFPALPSWPGWGKVRISPYLNSQAALPGTGREKREKRAEMQPAPSRGNVDKREKANGVGLRKLPTSPAPFPAFPSFPGGELLRFFPTFPLFSADPRQRGLWAQVGRDSHLCLAGKGGKAGKDAELVESLGRATWSVFPRFPIFPRLGKQRRKRCLRVQVGRDSHFPQQGKDEKREKMNDVALPKPSTASAAVPAFPPFPCWGKMRISLYLGSQALPPGIGREKRGRWGKRGNAAFPPPGKRWKSGERCEAGWGFT
jgi:hypothetical protein